MKKNKQKTSIIKSSLFINQDGQMSEKPSPTSIFGESRNILHNIDTAREYMVFEEANQPSNAVSNLMKEIFNN